MVKSDKEIIEMINRFSRSIFVVALSYTKCKATAEDIVQDTFMKYMQCEKNFNDDEHVKAWLIRVAINESKKFHRLFWNSKRMPLEDVYTVEDKQDCEVFWSVMNLPTKYRVVIHLHYYEGYSVKEIGEILALNQNTVLSRMHRARKMLKCDLEVNYGYHEI